MTVTMIIAAFGGGVFGSLISGTIAFVFTGILALTGFAVVLSGGDTVVLDQIAFGPFFGPQAAFVGAVAAAAYAGKIKQKTEVPVEGYDVNTPLFVTKHPMVLLVGGIFGVLGFVTNYLLANYTGLKIDTVALTVVIYGILSRFLLAQDKFVGTYPEGSKWSDGFSKNLLFDLIWSFSLSLVVGYAVLVTNLANIGWAVSAVSLLFLFTKLEGFPVSHHITMVAGYAAITFGNIYIAAVFGAIAMVMGEFFQRFTNSHVKSHIDMPAFVIAILSLIILTFFG